MIELNDEAPVTASLTMSLAASKGAVAAITSVARVDEARARSRAVAGRVRSFRRSQPSNCLLPACRLRKPLPAVSRELRRGEGSDAGDGREGLGCG